jgi:HEAT repeat protein
MVNLLRFIQTGTAAWRRNYSQYKIALVADLKNLRFPSLDLERVYVPLRLKEHMRGDLNSRGGGTELRREDMDKDQKRHSAMEVTRALLLSPRLVVLGHPGTGKTMLLKHLALMFAQDKISKEYVHRLTLRHQDKAAIDALIPIFIPLRDFANSGEEIISYLESVFARYGFPQAARFIERKLEGGECLLLLDGLDRVANEAKRKEVTDQINKFAAKYNKNQIVVTSRLADYRYLLQDFTPLEIEGFGDEEIEAFLSKWFGGHPERANGLVQAQERSQCLRSLAANPFLLSIIAMVYEQERQVPVRLVTLYDRCVKLLLKERNAAEGTTKQAQFDWQAEEKVLQKVAHHFHSQGVHTFSQSELLTQIGRLLPEIGEMSDWSEESLTDILEIPGVLHRSTGTTYEFILPFQEYLAAKEMFETGAISRIVTLVDDPWWQEVVVLFAGMKKDATDLIEMIRTKSTKPDVGLFLSARCLPEADETNKGLREKIRDDLFEVIQKGEPAQCDKAALLIAGIEGKKTREALTDLLGDENPELREKAVMALSRISTAWTVFPLMAALWNERWEVRKKAAEALGGKRDERAIQYLIRSLRDSNKEVRQSAAMALAAIGEPAVEPLVRALMDKKEQVREMAIMALAHISEQAVEPLIAVLGDKDENVRKGAAQALERIGEPAIDSLIRTLETKWEVQGIVAGILGRIDDERVVETLIKGLGDADISVREEVTKALVEIGIPAVNPLVQALGDERPGVPPRAVKALGQIGEPATGVLAEALEDKRSEVRWRAAEALGRIGSEQAVEPLIEKAISDRNESVRRKAIEVLGRIGDKRAMKPAIVALKDSEESVRWIAARVLGEIGDKQAVKPLIAALEDNYESVRESAGRALSQIGGAAVEPLIGALYDYKDKEVRQHIIEVLGTIGADLQGDPSMNRLAETYYGLLTGKYSLDEILPKLRELNWWKYGDELYQSFCTLDIFLKCQTLEDIAGSQNALAWLPRITSWLRPAVKEIFLGFEDTIKDMKYYFASSIRKNQQSSLLSARSRINKLQELIGAQPFEQEVVIFEQVVDHWRLLIAEAVRQLTGRAELECKLRTEQVYFRQPHAMVVLVLELMNTGNSVARSLSIRLRSAENDEFEVVEATKSLRHSLGEGEHYQVEFPILIHRPTEYGELTFEIRYDDAERQGCFYPFTSRVQFVEEDAAYKRIKSNPYIVGPPVKTPDMFFGRQDIFDWVRENISGAYQQNTLVLHGLRRMCKTSALYQLYENPPVERHVFILIDMEYLAAGISTGSFLSHIAGKIHKELRKKNISIPEPVGSEYASHPYDCFRRFHENLEKALSDKRVVLMIDEFEILIKKVWEGDVDKNIFHFLRGLMQHSESLAFVFSGTYELTNMLQESDSILFNTAIPYKISFLRPDEAEQLIKEPMKDYLDYHSLAIKKILRATACHPLFIQSVCNCLVGIAQREKKNFIGLSDVNHALKETIEKYSSLIQYLYGKELSEEERRALAALAEVTDEGYFVPLESIEHALSRYDLSMPKQDLMDALARLRDRDLIEEKTIRRQLQYSFRMGLVGVWLEQNNALLRLKEETR